MRRNEPWKRMGKRRSILSSVLVAACVSFLVVYNYLLSTSLPPQQLHSLRHMHSSLPVKIFMYDLPYNFTYGVIEQYLAARGVPIKNHSDLHYPGNQHSAEWFLFRDLLRPSDDRRSNYVSVTLDPFEADLFYVPFFSSLSLVVNPVRQEAGDNSYSDDEMQEQLVAWLEKQHFWRRHRGRDHVIVCQDPNALSKVIHRLENAVLLVSDFGRLKAEQASLVKDVVIPYSHRINVYNGDIGLQKRHSLLFFMGNRFRKEGGKVRNILFQTLEGEDDMIIKHGTQSRESRRLATQGMHTSKFCLHPAGDTPSACRLFDAIVSLCVPVIVSDDIELPFEDVIDYSKIAIFVASSDAVQPGYLASMLRSVTLEQILQYQRELKKVKKYFDYLEPDGAVNEIWRQKLFLTNWIAMRQHQHNSSSENLMAIPLANSDEVIFYSELMDG
ncbi:hypothetical protein SUGI_0826140 [Cryptomeria japonica]|nr:hypothetical protein SUGI_0826140 [Cryptomeria japonica]